MRIWSTFEEKRKKKKEKKGNIFISIHSFTWKAWVNFSYQTDIVTIFHKYNRNFSFQLNFFTDLLSRIYTEYFIMLDDSWKSQMIIEQAIPDTITGLFKLLYRINWKHAILPEFQWEPSKGGIGLSISPSLSKLDHYSSKGWAF